MAKQIKVGSRVMWRGSWGRDPAEETTVESIEKTTEPHCKEGTAVECISFDVRVCSMWQTVTSGSLRLRISSAGASVTTSTARCVSSAI